MGLLRARDPQTKGLIAAIILAVVVAASAWPLYSLINAYVIHRNDIAVRIYGGSPMSLAQITNASLTAIVFYPSPINGSTVFQVVYNGSDQGTFYISPKALVEWALGWLKKYGPKAYLWLEPSIIFGVAYPVNNGSDPYIVTQLFAEPFNLSYPLKGEGVSFSLVVSNPINLKLRPSTTVKGTAMPSGWGKAAITPVVEYWYPNSSGVAPLDVLTLVNSYNESSLGPNSKDGLHGLVGVINPEGSGVQVGFEIDEVPSGPLTEALNDYLSGESPSEVWRALGSIDVPGPSISMALAASSSPWAGFLSGLGAFASPSYGNGNVLQFYVMGQVAFVNWTVTISGDGGVVYNSTWQGFGPVITGLIVYEGGDGMVPFIMHAYANDSCTDIQRWAEGWEVYMQDPGKYAKTYGLWCPFPQLPAPVDWSQVYDYLGYLGTFNTSYSNDIRYVSYTVNQSTFGFSVNVGAVLGLLGAPEGLSFLLSPLDAGVIFNNWASAYTAEIIGFEAFPGVYAAYGDLGTNYFNYEVYNYGYYALPVPFVYGVVINK